MNNDWFCHECRRVVPPTEVTFDERHELCGVYIADSVPPPTCRDAFERWYGGKPEFGQYCYVSGFVQARREAWQAALAQKPVDGLKEASK